MTTLSYGRYLARARRVLLDTFCMPYPVVNDASSEVGETISKEVEKYMTEKDEFARSVGIVEERYSGVLPIYPIDMPVAGVTVINPRTGKASAIGVNKNLVKWYLGRVTRHELDHVLSEALLKYADMPEPYIRLVMESIPEYGRIRYYVRKGQYKKAKEILETTSPHSLYKKAIRFGDYVDQVYVSDIDGERGYRAFIRDIFKKGSMYESFRTLRNCNPLRYSGFNPLQPSRKKTSKTYMNP